jgi:hypothetical protein
MKIVEGGDFGGE